MQAVTFRIGKNWYGLPLTALTSVERMVPVRAVPGAPPHVLGLANLRGALIAVIDLRVCLNVDPTAPGSDARLLVMPQGAFLVDEVTDIVEAPETAEDCQELSELVCRFWSHGGRSIRLLDEQALAIL